MGWARSLNSNDASVKGETEHSAQVRREMYPRAPGSGASANLLDTRGCGEVGRVTHLRLRSHLDSAQWAQVVT